MSRMDAYGKDDQKWLAYRGDVVQGSRSHVDCYLLLDVHGQGHGHGHGHCHDVAGDDEKREKELSLSLCSHLDSETERSAGVMAIRTSKADSKVMTIWAISSVSRVVTAVVKTVVMTITGVCQTIRT